MNITQRLQKKILVNQFTLCHEWTGSITWGGYGVIKRNGKNCYTHRVAWELNNGPIPAGQVVDQKCRNRRCCNVDHMELVTSQVNTSRGLAARVGKRYPKQLPFSDIQRIRELKMRGASIFDLAHDYSLAPNSVSNICNFKRRVFA